MKKFALILPLLAGILWGTSGPFVRVQTADGLDNCSILFLRCAFAAVMMLIFLAVRHPEMLKVKPRDFMLFIGTGLIGMLGLNLTYTIAINSLTLSLAAVLLSMSPVFVIFMAAALFHEKITGIKTVCMIAGIAGCIMVSGLPENLAGQSISSMGVLCGILSAFFYALYSIISRFEMERGYHTYTITFYSIVISGIVLIPFSDYGAIGGYIAAAPISHTVFEIFHALFVLILPYIFFTMGLKFKEVGIVTIIASASEPSAAMVFGALLFSEIPSPLNFSGLVIVIAALAVLCLYDPSAAKDQPEGPDGDRDTGPSYSKKNIDHAAEPGNDETLISPAAGSGIRDKKEVQNK